jgi:hypothetical protein
VGIAFTWDDVSFPLVALWAAAGTAAGSVVWLVDASRRKQARREDHNPAIESPVVRAGLWFWAGLLLLTGLVVGYLGVDRFAQAQRMSRWPTAEATVVESHVKTLTFTNLSITTQSYTPIIRYRYAAGGQERESRGIDQSPANVASDDREKVQAAVDRYPVGSTHTVHYDPDEPDRAILEPGVPRGDALLFVVVPLAALAWALLSCLAVRAERQAPPP